MFRMTMTTTTVAVVSLVSFSAAAYDWPAKEDCLLLETSDTSSANSSYTNGAHWAGGVLPTSAQDCWVPKNMTIYAFAPTQYGYVFPGKSLTIDEGATLNASCAVAPTTSYVRFLAGSKLTFSSVPSPVFPDVTVDTTADKPLIVEFQRTGSFKTWPEIEKWSSTAASRTIFRWTSIPCNLVQWSPDFSSYFGAARLERSAKSLTYVADATNSVKTAWKMSGRLEVGPRVLLNRNDGNSSITGNVVSLESGSILRAPFYDKMRAFLTVTNKLELGSGVVFDVRNYTGAGAGDYSKIFPFIRLTDDAALEENLPDFTTCVVTNLKSEGYNYIGDGERLGLFDVPGCPGEKYYGHRSGRPLVSMSKTSSSTLDFTNTTCWAGGVYPTGENNVYVGAEKSLYVGTNFPDSVTLPFGGLILYHYNGLLQMLTQELTVTNLFLLDSARLYAADQHWDNGKSPIWRNGYRSNWLHGKYLGVYSGGGACKVAHSRMFVVDMPMYGDGPMTVTVNDGTSYPRGGIEFTQVNTNFIGKFTVASDGRAANVSSSSGHRLQFFATDARNIGGDMSAETFDGLTLRGDSLFIGVNSLCFCQKNRGLYVQDRIRFVMKHATDNTLVISNNVTYGGEMVFGNDYPNASNARVGKGGGTLVLGGKARFYDPANKCVVDGEVPANCTNKLTMLIGKLRPVTTNALDGVAVTFGAESDGLEIDADASAEMKAKGFRSVLAGSALVSNRTDGKIPVSVRGIDRAAVEAANNTITLAIATVATVRADEISNRLKINRLDHVRTRILPAVDNGDGTSTIFAECYRCGLARIVR